MTILTSACHSLLKLLLIKLKELSMVRWKREERVFMDLH